MEAFATVLLVMIGILAVGLVVVGRGVRGTSARARDLKEKLEFALSVLRRQKDRLIGSGDGKDGIDAVLRRQGELLETLSCQVRAEVSAISGTAHVLLATTMPDRCREQAETICSSARSIVASLDDALEYAALASSSTVLERAPFELRSLVEKTAEVLARAESARVELNHRVELDTSSRVIGDPDRLRRMLQRLTSAAIHFSGNGRVMLSLEGHVDPDGFSDFRLAVETGAPLANREEVEDLIARMLEGETEAVRRHRPGLALAICRRTVELMGGELGARIADGRLVFSFTVSLPLHRTPAGDVEEGAPAAEDRRREPAASSVLLPRGVAGARVLVVEDNPMNQAVALAMLKRLGCAVDVAASGSEALEMLEKLSYDLIFMDCQMPGMDGYAATKEIRRREAGGRPTPIVALTASAVQGDRERCLEAGMDDYLSKPARTEDLGRMLDRWCVSRTAVSTG